MPIPRASKSGDCTAKTSVANGAVTKDPEGQKREMIDAFVAAREVDAKMTRTRIITITRNPDFTFTNLLGLRSRQNFFLDIPFYKAH